MIPRGRETKGTYHYGLSFHIVHKVFLCPLLPTLHVFGQKEGLAHAVGYLALEILPLGSVPLGSRKGPSIQHKSPCVGHQSYLFHGNLFRVSGGVLCVGSLSRGLGGPNFSLWEFSSIHSFPRSYGSKRRELKGLSR